MTSQVKNLNFGTKANMNTNSGKENMGYENDLHSNLQKEMSQDSKPLNQRDIDEHDIPEYIEMLEEHQAICEREGRYVEAEIAKNRITELRSQIEIGKREEIKERHAQERQQLEEEHMTELGKFNEFWDNKMEEFNEQARAIEEQVLFRHQEEMLKFNEELERLISIRPKDSTELLNLRKIQQTLAKQKDYIEAHKVQQRCIKLEREEAEKWHNVREQKIKNQRGQLEHKQQNEINAIRKRITTGQEEQRKARSIDLERLLQKYQNIRKELTVRQQAELMQFNKPLKNGSFFGDPLKSQSLKLNQSSSSSLNKWTPKHGDSSKRQPLHEANVNFNKKR